MKKTLATRKMGFPNEPTITGPTDGDAGTSYPYDFVAEDPDLDDIAEFLVDWDDGNQETITGPFASGLGICPFKILCACSTNFSTLL